MVSYILRECFVMSALHLLLMANGVALAFPSVLAPALMADHADISTTDHQINLIMGIFATTGPFGYIVFPWIMQCYGRKITTILFGVCVISGSLVIATASSALALIVGRGLNGLAFVGTLLSCTIAAEYTHPRRRGVHIIVKGMSGAIGELLCHSLGLSVLSYRQTALLSLPPAILSIAITLRWPESPQYLAYKGRYDQCTAAFQWLRKSDQEANKELQELIESQKEQRKLNTGDVLTKAREAISSKGFLMLFFIIFVISVACHASGFLFLATYVNEIVLKMVENHDEAYYYTIAMDVMKILSMCVSSVIITLTKRRTFSIASGLVGTALIFAICVVYYLTKIGMFTVKWLAPSMFVLYYVIVNIAIVPALVVIQGELVPIKYKGVGTFFSGMTMFVMGSVVVNYTWQMILVMDLHWTFAVFVIISLISYIILYFILPETKDKTLQDIENQFIGKHNMVCDGKKSFNNLLNKTHL